MTFTKPQLDAVGADLLRMRARLASDLRGRLHDSGQDVPTSLRNYLADDVDPGEASEELADDLAWLGHDASGLRQVDAALRRIADGRYGTCVHCGAPIPNERLLALPAADSCVACQQAAERARRS